MIRLRSIARRMAPVLVAMMFGGGALQAQMAEGLNLSVTPSAERVFFDNDLLFGNTTYYGGRVGLHFGRHVSLEGYYLTSDKALRADSATLFDSSDRFGGDVVFTFAQKQFTPFVRLGAGVMTLEDSVRNELLTASVAAGLKFDLWNRLQAQVFVQDVAFRGSRTAAYVDPSRVEPAGGRKTFHNVSVGGGLNLFLGGRPGLTETDRVFQSGLRGVSFPVEIFGGQVDFATAFGLPDVTVAGVRAGPQFGPYVGLRGYYFGSAEQDFDDFNDFYGFGVESQFNLAPSHRAVSPFIVLGGGRLDFTAAQQTLSGFQSREWTATVGAGLGINLTERIALEAGVRSLLMSRDTPGDVTSPDQLESSWLMTGGLKFALGGSRGRRPDVTDPRPPIRIPVDAAATVPSAGPTTDRPADAASVVSDPDESALVRARLESLEREIRELRAVATGNPLPPVVAGATSPVVAGETSPVVAGATSPVVAGETSAASGRMIQIPAPERGEIYVRYGEAGVGASAVTGTAQPPVVGAAAATSRDSAGAAQPGRAANVLPLTNQPAPAAAAVSGGTPPAVSPEYEALLRAVERIGARIDAMEASAVQSDATRTAAALADVEARLEALRNQPTQDRSTVVIPVPGASGPEVVVISPEARPGRGVFRGESFEFAQVGVHTGASLSRPRQALLGVQVDLGSAFGGSARFVPEAAVGLTGDGTFNLNAHVLWPLPLRIQGFTTYAGGGLGILSGRQDASGDSDLELLLPNFVFGASRPVGGFELYGAFQGLDLFDDNRLIFGLRTKLGSRRTVVSQSTATSRQSVSEVLPSQPIDTTPARDDPERARLEAERLRLEAELAGVEGTIQRQRSLAAEEERAAEERRQTDARSREQELDRRRLEDVQRQLLARFGSLSVDVSSVSDVRQSDNGLVVEFGGRSVFASGQATLSEQAQSDVRALAALLVDHSTLSVSVEGHTDSTGDPSANRVLSERRATAVRRALEAYGLAPSRISVVGRGQDFPLASNATAAGRARNRRVEVIVIGLRRAS